MAESSQDHERRLHDVLGAYFEAVEAGQALRPEDLIARHPDLAADLADYFAGEERFHRLVEPLHATAADPAAASATAEFAPRSRLASPDPVATTAAPDPCCVSDRVQVRGARVRYFGDYELQSVVGEEGMGVVYRAKQVSLNRMVAVKMIRAGLWAGDDEVRRFKNEAEAIAGLDHPQIVPIYETGSHDGQHYFSMKLVGDASLAARLPRFVADPRAAALLVAEVARAVHHAHMRGILHRDLKPSNILLDADERPHVTDFGLAKKLGGDGDLSVSGSVLGTPAYMSPEQAAGRRGSITTATDVYGLGAVLYAALTGRSPFQAGDVMETLERVRNRAPESPSVLNRRVDRDLETICLKCLEKDPKRRYDSAAALADDLERYLRGEPVLARRTGTWERIVKWSRRRPAAAGLVGMGGFAALTLVGLGVALSYQARLQAAYAEKDGALARELTFLYQNRIAFAEHELNDNNPHRTDQLLNECPPRLRNLEWNYLKRQCHTELMTIHGLRGTVEAVAVSPDGRTIATAAYNDGMVRFWDAESGQEMRSLSTHGDGVMSVAFSPDRSLVASAGGRRSRPAAALLHNLATGAVQTLPALTGQNSSSVAFSPDGRQVVIASGEIGEFAESGTKLSGYVMVCDVQTGTERFTIKTEPDPAYSASFSPDGRSLIAVVGSSNLDDIGGRLNEVRVWDAKTHDLRFVLRGHTRPIMSASYSPDGMRIATAGYDSTVRVWDARDGRELLTFREHRGCTNYTAFSPDSRRIASTSDDGTARVWDAQTGQPLVALRGHQGGFYSVAFNPDGRRLVTGGYDGTVKVWDATTSPESRTISASNARVNAVAFSPDGRRIVTSGHDRTLRLWEVPTGRLIATWSGHTEPVWCVAFSPDGKYVGSTAGDWQKTNQPGEVNIWDAATGRVMHALHAHQGIARGVAFSPDSRWLVSGGGERTTKGQVVIIWDVATGTKLRSFPNLEAGSYAVAFSPDGQTVAATVGHRVQTWNVQTGARGVSLEGHENGVTGLAFSPDGRRILSSSMDGTLRLWETVTGRKLNMLSADKYESFGVAICHDGSRIASCGSDQTVKVWDIATSQPLISLRGHPYYVHCVAFSPDGQWIASSDGAGLVKLWDVSPWTEGGR